jgi:choline kinase
MRLIVLAAGRGSRLGGLAAGRPKALVSLAGRPLLDWTLEAAAACGVTDVCVVGGFGIDHLRAYPVTLLENPRWATTNMVETLAVAEPCWEGGFVMSYGDIAVRPAVLRAILASPAPIAVAVDLAWRAYWEARFEDPLADAETLRLAADGRITTLGGRPATLDEVEGQYIGLVAFRGTGVGALRRAWARARADAAAGRPVLGRRERLRALYLTDVLDALAADGLVHAVPIEGGWVEIDRPADIGVAEARWGAPPATAPGAVDPVAAAGGGRW